MEKTPFVHFPTTNLCVSNGDDDDDDDDDDADDADDADGLNC
jgi:hypothetical protein